MNDFDWKKLFFGLIFLLVTSGHAMCQWAVQELNLTHQYDPNSEVNVSIQPMVKSDSLNLLVELSVNQGKARLRDYSFDIFLAKSFAEKLNTPITRSTIDSTHLFSYNKTHVLKFAMPSTPSNWAIIRVRSKFSGFSFYFNTQVSGLNTSNFKIYQSNKPVVNSYISPGRYQTSKPIFGFYYDHKFNNALPPMVTKAPLPEKAMSVDSTFRWTASSSVTLNKEGLYYFQEDTTQTIGRGIRVEHKYFPKLATLPQLIEPLIYITTKNEKKELDGIKEKKEFDQFWLDLTNSSDRARKIIKEFYSRVEMANILFTTFKEGWKTDRGMIYIIYGPPNELIKTDTDETWVYLSNNRLPQIKFRFIKTDNIFSSSHYTLIRDKKYDDVWFKAVDFWRKSRF